MTPLPNRRHMLAALLAAPAGLRAEAAYPAKPIKLVVPFAAGGGPDTLTRQFLPKLGAVLGTTLYVENRTGAGGIVGAEFVAQQAPDGYTLLLGASSHLTQKLIQPKAGYDPLTSFTHVMRLSHTPALLVVAAESPFHSVDDLVRAARAEPGRLAYGSGGIGSPSHLAAAAFAHVAGFEALHVPFRGGVDLPQMLAGGHVQFALPTVSTVLPLLQAGRLRGLAISAAERDPATPNLPTLKELTGSDDLVQVAWGCLWLPAGAPPAVVKTLFDAITQTYADPALVKAGASQGVTIDLSRSPAEFAAFVTSEYAKVARLLKIAHVEPV